MKIKILLIIILNALFLIHPTVLVHAQERSFTISPPVIEATINPGDSREGLLTIRNNSMETISLSIFTKDFIVTDTTGTPIFDFDTNATNKYLAKDWISVYPSSFVLDPLAKQTLQYHIQVPTDANPGGHYAAVLYHPQASVATQGTTVQMQLASLFLIKVTGNITEYAKASLKAPSFQEYGPIPFTLTIQNQADVHIRPTGKVAIYDFWDREIQSDSLPEQNIFPTASREFHFHMGNTWMFGRFKIVFLGSYGTYNNIPLATTLYTWIIPWKAISLTLLCLAVIVLAIFVIKSRYHQPEETSTP